MIKPKLFVFVVMATISMIIVLGNCVTPVQANNSGLGTPTPTGIPITPVTGIPRETASWEQQEEIKSVVQAYFETRYQALSVSGAGNFRQNGFGSLVSRENEASVFLREEMGKLAVEIKRAELNRLRYVDYKYFLDFHSITIKSDNQIATVSVVENNDVIYEISTELNPQEPIISHMYNREHTITLKYEGKSWEIISDNYSDYLWRMLRQRGLSSGEMLHVIQTSQRVPISNMETSILTLGNVLSDDTSSHPYDRAGAVDYAINHAKSPNPNYYNYVNDGGDCTNFISQAIYEGGNASMSIPASLQPPSTGGDTNWFYLDYLRRARAWTDVNGFYEFVTIPGWGEGPEGALLLELDNYEIPETMPTGLMLGDVIQFEWGPDKDGNGDQLWDHAVIIVGFEPDGTPNVASRTEDYTSEPYMTFSPWQKIRFIHIERSDGYPPVRAEITSVTDDAGIFGESPTCDFRPGARNLYLGKCDYGGDVTSGFRFTGVQIPQGVHIKYAYVTFTVDGPYGVIESDPNYYYRPLNLQIFGINIGNSPAFPASSIPPPPMPENWNNNLTTGISWDITDPNNLANYWKWKDKRTTPNLAGIIQQITGLGYWQSGNALSLIFKNNGSLFHRRIMGFERTTVDVQGYWTARLIAAYSYYDPYVLSITRISADPTNSIYVGFTVTFSEPVTGVDASDFTLTTDGITGTSVSNVVGSGDTYTVTVDTGDGDGTLRLDVLDSGTGITDAEGNPLSGGFTNGEAYTIDKTPPDAHIDTQPPPDSNSTSATFTLSSTDSAATFECKLDAGVFASCTSPANYTNLADGSHTFYLQARDLAGNLTAAPVTYTWTVEAASMVFRSVGANDGWVLESTETSGVGGTLNATATTFRLGDDAADKQYRSILHFDTSSLPDTAVITSVELIINYHSVVGSEPTSDLLVDIRKPRFGTSADLEISDFQAAASKPAAASFMTVTMDENGTWFLAYLASNDYQYVNLTGTTQFRLRYALDDNNNNTADYCAFYSGNAIFAHRPQLVIYYYVP